MSRERVEVAVVGGGPAGAALAIHLVRAGRQVVVLERLAAPRWRACGVFSPTALRHLPGLGLSDGELETLVQPIPGLRLVAPSGTMLRLTYGPGGAAGFARPALDASLLAAAAQAGAEVRTCVTVTGVVAGGREPAQVTLRERGRDASLLASVVVGADGIRSIVARSAGVGARPIVGRRIGLTYHVAGTAGARQLHDDAAMVAFRGGYCGFAPVPGSRVNVGIVLDPKRWSGLLRAHGSLEVARLVLGHLPGAAGPIAAATDGSDPLEPVAGAWPLAHAVRRAAGPRWLLAGDAAGFLDPFTGEGLGRAFETAELGADAIDRSLAGDPLALERYDREVRRRYAARDRLSWLVQQFLMRPRLFDYAARRLADRDRLRLTLEEVLAERLPAGRALDPRFLLATLRP